MTTPFDGGDADETDAARRLRDVLREEAAMTDPSPDGLARIQSKIAMSEGSRAGWMRPLAAAAAVIVLVGVGVGLAATWGGGKDGTVALGSPSPSVTPSADDATPDASPTPTATQTAGETYSVTVYYVGKNAAPHAWLYRETEQRAKPAGGAVIRDAVTAMLTTPPSDPDYRNPWPAGTTVLGVTLHDGAATVNLSPEAAHGPTGMGTIAAQQLVYTVQAASKGVTSVALQIGGTPVSNLWGDSVAQPIKPADQVDVLAPMWIQSPTQGATVNGPTVTISGEATAWEATVEWAVTDAGGKQVQRGFVMASAGAPDRGTWTLTTKPLTPGMYTVTASVTTGSEEGPGLPSDTKTFSVQATK